MRVTVSGPFRQVRYFESCIAHLAKRNEERSESYQFASAGSFVSYSCNLLGTYFDKSKINMREISQLDVAVTADKWQFTKRKGEYKWEYRTFEKQVDCSPPLETMSVFDPVASQCEEDDYYIPDEMEAQDEED